LKKTLYPKTQRVSNNKAVVTEKLDGSNLGIGVLEDVNCLVVAQRNHVFFLQDIEDLEGYKDKLYKGLYGWLREHWQHLSAIHPNSVVFGEWIGMGKIKYDFENKWHIFAKGILECELRDGVYWKKKLELIEDASVRKIDYTLENLVYPFGGAVPDFITTVPLVDVFDIYPTKEQLDDLYAQYEDLVGRKVEGMIVNHQNNISKYARYKNGKPQEHSERG